MGGDGEESGRRRSGAGRLPSSRLEVVVVTLHSFYLALLACPELFSSSVAGLGASPVAERVPGRAVPWAPGRGRVSGRALTYGDCLQLPRLPSAGRMRGTSVIAYACRPG